MMTDRRVSVALATFDGERFVAELFQSLLAQSRPADEIIVADDGSTDHTIEIVRQVSASAPEGTDVRIVESGGHLGVVSNFERAVRMCTGDIIFLCDQDDVWAPDKIRRTVEQFDRPNGAPVGVFTNGALIDEAGIDVGSTLWDRVGYAPAAASGLVPLAEVLRWNPVTGATLAFDSTVCDLLLPFPDTAMHDHWAALMLAAVGGLIHLDEPLIRYRLHSSNAVGLEATTIRKRLQHRRSLQPHFTKSISSIDEASSRLRTAGDIDVDVQRTLDAARRYLEHRRNLSSSALRRAPQVASMLSRGMYHRQGRGLRSAAYDVVYGPS